MFSQLHLYMSYNRAWNRMGLQSIVASYICVLAKEILDAGVGYDLP